MISNLMKRLEYEIDKSLKYLQAKLDKAIQNIADNVEVDIAF